MARATFTNSVKFSIFGAAVIASSVLSASACTGKHGEPGAPGGLGATGPQGAPGTPGPAGVQGLAGPPGVSPDGGGLPSSCLSPCHGFNGVVEQWKTSTHYAAFVSNLNGDEVATWTGPGSCGNCHALDAIAQRTSGGVGTVGDAGVANAQFGELSYLNPVTSKVAESTYKGTSKVASVTCVTCHSVTDASDPHRTGKAYTQGDFPLRVPSATGESAYIEKSAVAGSVTGTPVLAGVSNTCIWCHKSRKDVTNYITASNSLSVNWGPHQGPQADIVSGAGGYHFAGMSYGQSTHQLKLTCVDCHMPDVPGNGGSPNHSFYAQIGACTSCHPGVTNFDISGGQGQVKASIFELQKVLNEAGYLTRSTAAPYAALSASELADGAFASDRARPIPPVDGGPSTISANQAGALYNYFLIARGSALGVHNPKYVRQLIFDSYMAIKASPPTTLVRPQ